MSFFSFFLEEYYAPKTFSEWNCFFRSDSHWLTQYFHHSFPSRLIQPNILIKYHEIALSNLSHSPQPDLSNELVRLEVQHLWNEDIKEKVSFINEVLKSLFLPSTLLGSFGSLIVGWIDKGPLFGFWSRTTRTSVSSDDILSSKWREHLTLNPLFHSYYDVFPSSLFPYISKPCTITLWGFQS